MNDPMKELADELKSKLLAKQKKHKAEVQDSQQFKLEQKLLNDFSHDAIQTIRTISFYSTRAGNLYDSFLTIRASDDLLQSIFGIRDLVFGGIQNIARREIRYMLEMTVKYLLVDQVKSGSDIETKTQYLETDVPNSSIEVIDKIILPFDNVTNIELRNEVKDLFYKSCAYVHPSKKQIDEQLSNYDKGNTIGFETSKSLANTNKILFRAYDIILTLLFIGFGQSMSGDLFIEIYDSEPKWKFHKGKYLKKYSDLFNYKLERQKK